MNSHIMLPVGTILRHQYRIDKQLASGGFGNTYKATNLEFDEVVAIKEFFMKGVTERNETTSVVSVSNADNVLQFEEQREKFKKEARRLRDQGGQSPLISGIGSYHLKKCLTKDFCLKKVFTFTRIVLSHSAIRVNSVFSLF